MGAGGEVDDAGGGAGLDAVEEELGKEEMAQVVDAEGGLEPLLRLPAAAEDEPGVIDQDVKGVVALEEVGSEAADGGEGGEVQGHELDVGAAASSNVGRGLFALSLVARGEGDGSALTGEGHRRLLADARVAAGDEDGLAFNAPGHRGLLLA